LVVQLSCAREAEKRWRCSSVVGYSPDSNDVSTEVEEFLLLEAVTRKRLLKKLQVGGDLMFTAVICKV
jgi:hypothetical protein